MSFENKPLVSVIVPNYNHAPYLEKRLSSIFSQTYPHREVIVLDDCSTDNSLEVLERLKEIYPFSLYPNTENSGSTFRQWKKGLGYSNGEFIWIAESDDEAAPTFLSVAINALKDNWEAALFFSHSSIMDEKGNILGTYKTHREKLDRFYKEDRSISGIKCIGDYMAFGNLIPNVSSVVFRKVKMPEIDATCQSFKLLGDWYYYIQCLKAGGLEFVAAPLNRYRVHAGTVRKATLSSGLSSFEHLRILDAILNVKKWGWIEKHAFFSSFYARLGYKLAKKQLSTSDLAKTLNGSMRMDGSSLLSSVHLLSGYLGGIKTRNK